MNVDDIMRSGISQSRKRHIVGFQIYEAPKSRQIHEDKVEWWLPGAEELFFNGYGVPVGQGGKVLEMDGWW